MAHPDVLDQRQSLGKPFATSLFVHAAIAGALVTTWTLSSHMASFGDPHPSSGSVGVTMVKTIPIPAKAGREQRVANDTQSVVPNAPPQKKEKVKTPPPPPKAIPIPSRTPPKKPQPEQAQKYVYKPRDILPNQVTSSTPEALKSPNFALQGNNGIGLGENSTLGTQFGYYINLMRERIGSKWNTAGLTPDQRIAVVTFTIMRDGSVRGARIAQASGNYGLDTSAVRAVLEASPLPPLPPNFNKDSATVELSFQVPR
jgi:protein TonB